MKTPLLAQLSDRAGQYEGRGTNHENLPFLGALTFTPLLGGAGFTIHFKAKGEDGTLFHEEHSTIAPSIRGGIGLFNLNTNVPGLVPHQLIRQATDENGTKSYVFAFGDRAVQSEFREEITLELFANGDVGYRFAWGMPGGDFSDRSGLVMRRLRSQ